MAAINHSMTSHFDASEFFSNTTVSFVANAGNATWEKHSDQSLVPGRCLGRASVNASHPSISSFTSVVIPFAAVIARQIQSTVNQSRLNATTRSMSLQAIE